MKIILCDIETEGHRKTIDASGWTVELRDVFNGVGIQTDQGHFGIAQRDGGIEVMLDGRLVWSSSECRELSERAKNEIYEECAVLCDQARAHAEKHYGVAEGVGADMAARKIRNKVHESNDRAKGESNGS